MNFDKIIDEHKKKSILINGLVIDLQYLIELAPQVFNKNADSSPKFKEACESLIKLCDRGEIQLKELKTIIPTPTPTAVVEKK